MSKFVRNLIYISLFLVVVLAIVFIFIFINNGQKNFYVQYGEREIRNKAENVEIPVNSYSTFYCKNFLGLGAEYTVRIVFAEKLEFGVNNEPYTTNSIQDISGSFNLVKDKDFFTLYADKDLTFYDILRSVYPDKVISYKNVDFAKKDCFKLIVTSANNDKDIVSINFHLGGA